MFSLSAMKMPITTDNASSNDTFIDRIVKLTECDANALKKASGYAVSHTYIITTYIVAIKYPTLLLVFTVYSKLLYLLEKVSTDRTKHSLIQKHAQARLVKFSSFFGKASPTVMTATFMDLR